MKGRIIRLLSLALLLCLLIFSVPAFAQESEPEVTDMRIYIDGLLSGRGYACSGTALLPVEDLCRFFAVELSLTRDEAAGKTILSGPGLDAEIPDGKEYLCANQRYLYAPGGAVQIGGELYRPAEAMAKLLNLSCSAAEAMGRIDLDSSQWQLIRGSSTYYSDNFGNEDVFWLARIIHAEAANQPLAGQIGVGNVVFNRVDSDQYPDTVIEVIFDQKHNIQFEPVMRGTVYAEPDEQSLIAAYLCLEGYNTVEDCMYFVNPAAADDSWFRGSLSFYATIGDHDFYR